MIFQKIDSSHLESVLKILKDHESHSKDFKRFGLSLSDLQVKKTLSQDVNFGLLDSSSLIAFVLGRAVGGGIYEVDMTMTDVLSLKKGFMEKLFRELVLFLKKGGGKEIWLEVHEENAPAIHLYQKIGFEENAKRSKYYPDGKAALLMTLTL